MARKQNNFSRAISRKQAQAKDTLGQRVDMQDEAVLDYPEDYVLKGESSASSSLGTAKIDRPISEINDEYTKYNMETPVSGDDLAKMTDFNGRYGSYNLRLEDKATPRSTHDSYESEAHHGVYREFDNDKDRIGHDVTVKSRPRSPVDRASDPARAYTPADTLGDPESLADIFSLDDYRKPKDSDGN